MLHSRLPMRHGTPSRVTALAVAGTLVAALAAVLAPTGASADPVEVISGTVTADGPLMPEIFVEIVADGAPDYEINGEVPVNQDGTFTITAADLIDPTSDNTLYFTTSGDTHFPEYYNDTTNRTTAQRFTFGDGISDTGLSVHLTRGGAITGRVTEEGRSYAENGFARAERVGSPGEVYTGKAAPTEGFYHLGPLPAGDYYLSFGDEYQAWETEHWPNVQFRSQTQVVHVPAATTLAGYDAYLKRAVHIGGQLFDEAGTPLPGIEARLYSQDEGSSDWSYRTTVVSQILYGSYPIYRFDPLRPGKYRICFVDTRGMTPVMATECWNNQGTVAAARTIDLTNGDATESFSALLAPTAPTGVPTPPEDFPGYEPPTPTDPPPTTPTTPPNPETPGTTPTTPTTPTNPSVPTSVSAETVVAQVLAAADVAGKVRIGKTVKVVVPAQPGVTARFQWFAGKKAISEATKAKLKLTRQLRGKKVSVRITATAPGVVQERVVKVGKVR